MTTTAEAIVVGGGVVGASTAFQLATLGLKRVLLCERGGIAAGASGKSAAFIQMHMRTAAEARLCAASMPYFLHWDDLVGAGQDAFVQTGYLRTEPKQNADKLRKNVAMLQDAGIRVSVLSAADVHDIAPYLRVDDVAVAAHEPDGGFANAINVTLGFAERARQLGVEIMMGTGVLGLTARGGKVTGVVTPDGPIAAPVVIVAAGVWSGPLLQDVGIDLPVECSRAQVAALGWTLPPGSPAPMAIMDGVRQVYYRPDGLDRRGVLAGLGAGGRRVLTDPDRYEQGVDADFAATCERLVRESAPFVTNIVKRGGRAGPVHVTPDRAPIIDQAPQATGLFFAIDSGRSFKTAPAIGRALAEWAVQGTSHIVDLHPFRLSRIAEGDLLVGDNEYEDPGGDFADMRAAAGRMPRP